MTPRSPSSGSLVAVAALGIAALAGCASTPLNRPQVVDWSSGAQPAVSSVSPSGATVPRIATYTVRPNDTLASIALRFNTTPAELAAWNNLPSNARVRPDQVLRVTPPQVDQSPVATTVPIGSESVEARPLGPPGVVATSPPGNVPSGPSTSADASNAPLKTGPLGLKKPYSDATLAEMSRRDADAPTPANASPPIASIAPTTPPATSAISWTWPTTARASGGFDEKAKGVDFGGQAGDPVLAAADGRVTFAGTGVRGYGNFVIVQHSPDLLSVYAHNRANLVKEGATVTKGQKIAEMGSTDADGVKLHFEIRRDSKPVDPLQYLPPR